MQWRPRPARGTADRQHQGVQRRTIYEQVAAHEIDVLVGTQAVIQENVAFANLGLAVVDEQHRFGVKQRVALREKGGHTAPRRDDSHADPADPCAQQLRRS